MSKENRCSCSNDSEATTVEVHKIESTIWSWKDRLGAVLVRFSNRFRMRYRVAPGLYSSGEADANSPILVTANYRLSFNIVRKALTGLPAWLLVLDTKGINVWCAAGKGTFGTNELVNRIKTTGLSQRVTHRTVIVPQLGAPGLVASKVLKESGFRVVFGPVRAADIPSFIESGNKATTEMRKVRFGFVDRMILVPIEVLASGKIVLPLAAFFLALAGVNSHGFLLIRMFSQGVAFLLGLGIALFAGTILTPLLLPWIPCRSFSLKGLLIGIVCIAPFLFSVHSLIAKIFFLLLAPTLSSYWAFNFTGCTTFTNPSGVRKELKIALPLYIISGSVSLVLLLVYKFKTWG